MSIIKKFKKRDLICFVLSLILVVFAILFESVREHGEVYELNYRLMTDEQRARIFHYSSIYTVLMFLLVALVIYTFYNCIKFLMSFRVGKSLPIFLIFLTLTMISFSLAFVAMRWVLLADVKLHLTGEIIISSLKTVFPLIGMILCAYMTERIEDFSDYLDTRKYIKNEKENDKKLMRLKTMMNDEF